MWLPRTFHGTWNLWKPSSVTKSEYFMILKNWFHQTDYMILRCTGIITSKSLLTLLDLDKILLCPWQDLERGWRGLEWREEEEGMRGRTERG